MIEQSLVLIKPDGVERGLVGVILQRFERVGLKIVAIKMVQATAEQADKHYVLTEEWMKGVFEKSKAKYEADGKEFNYTDYKTYGQYIKNGLMEFLTSAPLMAMVLEGEQVVSLIRKLVGATEPASAAPGTIRGDFSPDTYQFSNSQDRPLRNLIHASGTPDEAKSEIAVWFLPAEIMKVNSAADPVIYDGKRFKKP